MLFNKKNKKGEGLPDLQPRPTHAPSHANPAHQEEHEEAHELPSFPDSPMNKGFSQSAIKEAINSEEGLPEIIPKFKENSESPQNFLPPPENDRKHKFVELEEWGPGQTPPSMKPSKNTEEPLAPMPPLEQSRMHQDYIPSEHNSSTTSKKEPVFVRIDKFQSAKESLDKIQSKVAEMESMLREIRELKRKEDAEIASWEREMEIIKGRMETINQDIFSKI